MIAKNQKTNDNAERERERNIEIRKLCSSCNGDRGLEDSKTRGSRKNVIPEKIVPPFGGSMLVLSEAVKRSRKTFQELRNGFFRTSGLEFLGEISKAFLVTRASRQNSSPGMRLM